MLLSPAFHQHVAEGKMRLTVDTRLNYDDLLMEIERQKEVLIASKRLEELLRPRVPPKMPASMPLPIIRKPASTSPPPTAAQQSSFFPFNPSLEDELNRLFANSLPSPSPPKIHDNEVWEEFRHNGKDFEYCPDPDGPLIQVQPTKKKSKKPLPTECVFCKNNGEDVKIYKKHLLKDADGKILCPILRKYTCPLCGCNGDLAHTVKYCPNNKQPQLLAPMNALKSLRNSTGRRRSK